MVRASVAKPVVCLTLDGLLARHVPGRIVAGISDPLPGAVEFTRRLGVKYTILIYTSRANTYINPDRPELEQIYATKQRIKSWLDAHAFWYDDIWMGQGKPIASLYVGPRCLGTVLNPSPDDMVEIEADIAGEL